MLRSLLLAGLAVPLVCSAAGPRELRYSAPATAWSGQPLPIGNGSVGAMIYGSPLNEEIQFNDNSLWTGNDNPAGDYGAGMGDYQNFGSLFLMVEGNRISNPSEGAHTLPDASQGVANSHDGTDAKWCLLHQDAEVLWQADYSVPTRVTGYTLRSAGDVAERDPLGWVLQGSTDGEEWVDLDDRRADGSTPPQHPFAQRNADHSFDLPEAAEFAHYRLRFTPNPAVPHFQLAEITLEGAAAPTELSSSRVLDLDQAVHRVEWTDGAIRFQRESFASHPDQVLVTRWSSSEAAAISFTARLVGAHGETAAAAAAGQRGQLVFHGALDNGLRYATELWILADGGVVETDGNLLRIRAADEVLILHAAATDYALEAEADIPFRSGIDPRETVAGRLAAALERGHPALLQRHLEDYQTLFRRAALDLGDAPAETEDTAARLTRYRAGAGDNDLESLLFDFGRYLIIASSRDGLPANLQGLWNNSNSPPWKSDYHVNINLQMNYWSVEPTHLSECARPLLDFIEEIAPLNRRFSRASHGEELPGWTMRTSLNPFGGNGWEWDMPSSAWIMRHFWEHYCYTGDQAWLREHAWPLMEEVCEFWLARLTRNADGKLVAPQGWSPEHGPRQDGTSYDQEIVWDLFTNTIAAAEALGDQSAFKERLEAARADLLVPAIGPQGQIVEWADPATEAAIGYGKSGGHRHTSHLYGLYPGFQFNLVDSAEYVDAGRLSLLDRGTSGDSRHSWTWVWRCGLWARMNEAERGGEMIRGYLTHNVFPNLTAFAAGVFQLDGPLGMPGVMSELLLQSHFGEISLLPALPEKWASGSFRGLRARGGYTVDASWAGGRLQSVAIQADAAGPVRLRLPAGEDLARVEVRDDEGNRASLPVTDGVISFPVRAGGRYEFDLRP